jgi:hypothetical protein
VARIRNKQEYELGDLSIVLDQVDNLRSATAFEISTFSVFKVAKDAVCEVTGKAAGEYEFGK